MCVTYRMIGVHSAEIIPRLKAGELAGLQHVAAKGPAAEYWPDGVTDGTSTAWFEGDMLIVWGGQPQFWELQSKLRQNGIGLIYIG